MSSLCEKDSYLINSRTKVIIVKRQNFHSCKKCNYIFHVPLSVRKRLTFFGNGCLSIPPNANRLGRSSDGVLMDLKTALIARVMGPTWGPPGDDRTQLGPMWATWTLLSGILFIIQVWCQNWRHCCCEFDITILNNKSQFIKGNIIFQRKTISTVFYLV